MPGLDDQLLRQMAKAAGLERALEQFPDDIRAAIDQVEKQRQALRDPLAPAEEPWPPMQVPGR